ncbi:MAG: heme-binding protein [Planctomycetales bacterium]|nr:heme-binding protein [Planctomycetales bacterium]
MNRPAMFSTVFVFVAIVGTVGLAITDREGYESAEYKVIQSDGAFEIREYPDLILAATESKMDSQGRDGSFMRLFQYISGANKAGQKIEMTTPVFMEGEIGKSEVSMGFVMPKLVATEGAPDPQGKGVQLRERKGGRFAVIRFSGRLDSKSAKLKEEQLRDWMTGRSLTGVESAEAAGYNPPFTPAASRRNEILIRLTEPANEKVTIEAEAGGKAVGEE